MGKLSMSSVKPPYIHLIETNWDHRSQFREWVKEELPEYPVLDDPGAIQAMNTFFEVLTGPTIFIIAYDASDVGGYRLAEFLKFRFRFPSYRIVLIPKGDRKLMAEVLRQDAEPFEVELREDGTVYVLDEVLKERILSGQRQINLQAVDQLTGAYLRGQALEMWRKDFIIAKKNRTTTAFIYLDVNYFGAINGAISESMADPHLAFLGSCLQDLTTPKDIVCRQGGDEFLIVLNDSSAKKAEEFIRKLRLAVSESVVEVLGMRMPLSFSAGYAVIRARGLGADAHEALKKGSVASNAMMRLDKRKMHAEIIRGPHGHLVKLLLELQEKNKKGS